jgi:hypothetical protein
VTIFVSIAYFFVLKISAFSFEQQIVKYMIQGCEGHLQKLMRLSRCNLSLLSPDMLEASYHAGQSPPFQQHGLEAV